MFLKKGYVLGNRYEILEKIGAGGMSIVYKAYCTHLKRIVAIKVLREEFIENEEFVNKFKSEATLVASLSHQNIVNIYDVGKDGDFYYIVMEYLDGKDLETIVHKLGKIDQTSALTILYNICEALKYAHENGIIHRDLKSKNIIINDDGVVKVADFGIATAATTNTISVATNAIGSVHYFSPEQAKGELVDQRSDIYSLGIIGYELFTGDLPFDGETPVQVALKQVSEEMPRPSEKAKVSSSVDFLILKATEKDPLDRYQTINDMLQDIDKILDGKDITIDRMVGDEIKKDEVSKFSKILEENNNDEIYAVEERKANLNKQAQIARENLSRFDDINERLYNEEDNNEYENEELENETKENYIQDTINEISEFKKQKEKISLNNNSISNKEQSNSTNNKNSKDKERKEKFNKLLVKLGIVNDEENNTDNSKQLNESQEEPYGIKDEDTSNEINFDNNFNIISKKDKNKIEKEDNIFKTKNYISLDKPISSNVVNQAREEEKLTKAKIAATRFFDDNEDDEEVVIVKNPEKKKFSLFNFITVEVDDNMSEEEYKQIKREKRRKKREEKYLETRKDEEMVDGYISKNDDRNIVKAAVITSLIIILFILFGMIKFIMYLTDNKLVEVPNYIGLQYEDIKDNNFILDVIDEEASNDYEKGIILSQNYEQGKMIPRHTKIEIVLSSGKIQAIMPDLEARTVSEALAALEKYNVHITTQTMASEAIGKDCIVQTSPAYGSKLEKGENVILYVSDGSGTKYMCPNLIGLTEEEAKAALEAVGLTTYKINYQTDDKEHAVVVRQSENEGSALFMGAGVSIDLNTTSESLKKTSTSTQSSDNDSSSTQTTSVKIDIATIRIESKLEGKLIDDQEYTVEIFADQPTLEDKYIYRDKLTGKQINDTFKKSFELEVGSNISLYIDEKLQKTVTLN